MAGFDRNKETWTLTLEQTGLGDFIIIIKNQGGKQK
jgi:hypothetical protein